METKNINIRTHNWLDVHVNTRKNIFLNTPELIYPWWLRACRVRVLLVTDGGLDFGMGDFGLSTFVSCLINDGRSYARFEITLAHRDNVSNEQIQVGAPGIARSIRSFRFDEPDHFTPDKYDQVWLFGINGGESYLRDEELRFISQFMNAGGGLFATGDHGSLGRGLCGAITRVRSMRRWDNSSGQVGMSDEWRNDTNRNGRDAQSFFDDQSDDVPQDIQPKMYSSRLGRLFREYYPHPLLCSPLGMIKVLPDHPHEGECIEPADLSQTYLDGSAEYPMGIAPEIIATSSVPANNRAGTKDATQAHSFGAICAYDGHRANVGRVVTDATWHHFVNVNLIGELDEVSRDINAGQNSANEDDSKDREPMGTPSTHGYLFSASGRRHFEFIKHYYVNIAVWISRPSQIECFNTRTLWQLFWQHRVMEATMSNPLIRVDKIPLDVIYAIGTHARDVIGKSAGHCRHRLLVLDILRPILPELIPSIDPWLQKFKEAATADGFPWLDPRPLMDLAIGSGVIAIRDAFMDAKNGVREKEAKQIMEVFQAGAKRGVEMGLRSLTTQTKSITSLLKISDFKKSLD